MGVYFRTSRNTAAGVSWPIYAFFILPLQLVALLIKAMIYVLAALGLAVTWAHNQWTHRKTPPAT